ncbi:MAG: ribose 5-phosphate isomerase B [Planctomycetota bacterium]|jgi:ribose 5-phosphate isomerase B
MKIAVAADHRGRAIKEMVVVLLNEHNHDVLDMGTNSSRSCDYPDLGYKAARAVAEETVDRGILVCGTGIGMSIVANKVKGIRAAVCNDELAAEISRRHNDANVLCLAADVLGDELIRRIVVTWLNTDFEGGGRHSRRVAKIGCIEEGIDPATYHAGRKQA